MLNKKEYCEECADEFIEYDGNYDEEIERIAGKSIKIINKTIKELEEEKNKLFKIIANINGNK